MNISSRTFTGPLHNQNKGACDWGWQSLFAYGCHTLVVVIDTKTVQVLQTLDSHKSNVVKVKWAKENYHHTIEAPYTLRLASADSSGLIVIWDVANGSPRTSFSEGTKAVADLEWLGTQDASHDLLVALHPPYSVVLWNADTGTKLWKKSFTDSLQSLAFDPFEPSNLTLLGNDSLIFINDFSLSKPPSSNGKKFYITTSSPASQGSASTPTTEKKQSISGARTAFRRVRMIVGDTKPNSNNQSDEQDTNLKECLQFCYLKSQRHHLVLVYAREILILDLEIRQTVTAIPMDRSGCPFMVIHPLRHRDILMCLHENGTISVRMHKKSGFGDSNQGDVVPSDMEISYDLRCQSDPLRVTKHMKTFGFSVSPVSESEAALLMSDGRILFWSLITVEHSNRAGAANALSQLSSSPLYSPGGSQNVNGDFELLPPLGANLDQNLKNLPQPKMFIGDLIQSPERYEGSSHISGRSVSLKFVLTGFVSGVSIMPTIMRMCPPLTTKNFHIYKPLLAIGTSSGLVQVFNLLSGTPYREYNIHTTCVRGIEWLSLNCFLSFSHPNPGSTGLVRNEMLVLDLQTGHATPLRENKGDESPVEALKVSHLKQYLIVLFKEKPFEIWDLRTYTLLREMKKSFPPISALEWSPTVKKKSSNTDLFGSTPHIETSGLQSMLPASESNSDTKIGQSSLTKEHFVFAEASGPLHHFIIENTSIKEGSRLPANNGLNYISCMAWKGEMIVMADPDGVLGIWDLKHKISRNYPTGRSGVKKVRFAPGKGNLKMLLFWNDGLDIWDLQEKEMVSSMKNPKDEDKKIVDVDWGSSNAPLVLTADGCLRVFDLALRTCTSPFQNLECEEPIFSPYLLPPKAALAMKHTLQHQPWNDKYLLEIGKDFENLTERQQEDINKQFSLIPKKIQNYIPYCPYGTAQRCLMTGRLFGDEAETIFWTVALYYLKLERMRKISTDEKDDKHWGTEQMSRFLAQEGSLDGCFDILTDSSYYKKYQLDRVNFHDSKRASYEQTISCAEHFVLLGQSERAVQLFLETESDNSNYHLDLLRACLVTTVQDTSASQSTIKLVATSLIANGKLTEGVQLLSLINKGLDACRYLQTYSKWYDAAWLAKATLPASECSEVLRRWVDHLCSPPINQKSPAILVLLSLGHFQKVLEMLLSLHFYDRAALFAEACLEFGVLPKTDDIKSLLEKVFLEYANYMLSLDNRKAYGYYCQKAADKSDNIIRDLEWIN